ncbi:DUF4136 domain-containing protein [Reichenbachiella carrageenanivorans]|uniref:DUF4136 domain-containing protein n=1 Tax=Reichenbachiella carrageenanivorans TaxID=2979869 RepID=A0ABY6CWB3_9BACT|nr:DUF4136 domain-containing protein [Reichenbachiella carrageenanivorans]UXX78158.1 DUF4136 domain-containing protein [Reichenbachiella carrageenanivorans]
MKTTMNTIGFMLAMLLITNLSFAQVKSDYDKEADFTQYKSYTFAGWQDDSDKILNDFDKKRILDALKSEFSDRGMELVEADGDAVITLFVVVNQKTSTTAYTDFNGGMGYRGRWGWGMGAGMATATTTYSENDYNEGTLVIDMYDASGKQLIWQGVMTSTVQEKPKKREKTIPKKMAKLMKSYPVKKK